MATENSRQAYEAPTVTDFGDIDDVTKGPLAISLDDGVLGAKVIDPVVVSPVG
ncbi:MAG TPA: lasso RiPP family leader peptide-containing protein [Actinomycetota bacterium]